jgi:hypothetical protein
LKAGLGSLQIGESDHRFGGACRHRQTEKHPSGAKARVKGPATRGAEFPAR